MSTDVAESAPGWVEPFEHALTQGDPLGASDALRKSGVNGWVRKDSYDRAVEIVDRIAPAPVVRLNWAERLLAHPRRVDKELGALIVAPLAKPHWRELSRIAYRLARDEPEADEQKDPDERELLPDGSGIERLGSGPELGGLVLVAGAHLR